MGEPAGASECASPAAGPCLVFGAAFAPPSVADSATATLPENGSGPVQASALALRRLAPLIKLLHADSDN